MDWDRRSAVLWLAPDAGYPTDDEFDRGIGSIKYEHAIEALRDIYVRQAQPVPPTTKPWMRWNDGTIFTPGQIEAVHEAFSEEVAVRGAPVPH
jgi:hypothetical protein